MLHEQRTVCAEVEGVNKKMDKAVVIIVLSTARNLCCSELCGIVHENAQSHGYNVHSRGMLGDYVLITAYRYGIKIDVKRMLKVIEYTRYYFNDKKDGVIYRARYIDKEDWNDTCDRLNISKTNYYKRVNKILNVARRYWRELKG